MEPHFQIINNIFMYKNRFCLSSKTELQKQMLEELHASKEERGHSGYVPTLHQVRRHYWWRFMAKDIKEYIEKCNTCQQIKPSNKKPLGLLLPLQMPNAIWEDLSMDVTHLSTVKSKLMVVVVVDRLSKYYHLGALSSHYTASSMADFFVDKVVMLHGVPKIITSD